MTANDIVETLFNKAEKLRIADRPAEATVIYHQALEYDPSLEQKRRLFHMNGVAHKMLGGYEAALTNFNLAMDAGITASQLGHVLRDKGDTLSLMGRYEEAEDCLEESMRSFLQPGASDQVGHLESMGFLGRHKLRTGDLQFACALLDTADESLGNVKAYQAQLYNKFPLAVSWISLGRRKEALQVLHDAFYLNRKYGSPRRFKRLVMLVIGAFRRKEWVLTRW